MKTGKPKTVTPDIPRLGHYLIVSSLIRSSWNDWKTMTRHEHDANRTNSNDAAGADRIDVALGLRSMPERFIWPSPLIPKLSWSRKPFQIEESRVDLVHYLCALALFCACACACAWPSILSGALGPTIQSSIASHSLQLFSAASISAMTGPCNGLMNGTVSSGSMS